MFALQDDVACQRLTLQAAPIQAKAAPSSAAAEEFLTSWDIFILAGPAKPAIAFRADFVGRERQCTNTAASGSRRADVRASASGEAKTTLARPLVAAATARQLRVS